METKMLLRLVALVSLAPSIHAISETAVALNQPAASVQAASTDNGGLVTEGVATLDGLALDAIAEGRSAEAVMSSSIPKTDWVATADSYQPDHPPANVLDDDLTTFWHTTYTPGAPPSARTGVSKFYYYFPTKRPLPLTANDCLAPELAFELRFYRRIETLILDASRLPYPIR